MILKNTGVALLLGILLPWFVLGNPASKEERNGVFVEEPVIVEKDGRLATEDVLKNVIRSALDSELTKSILKKALHLELHELTNNTLKLQDEVVDLPNTINQMSEEVDDFNELLNFESQFDRNLNANRRLEAGKNHDQELDDWSWADIGEAILNIFRSDEEKAKRKRQEKIAYYRANPDPHLVKSLQKLLNDSFDTMEEDYLKKIPEIERRKRKNRRRKNRRRQRSKILKLYKRQN